MKTSVVCLIKIFLVPTILIQNFSITLNKLEPFDTDVCDTEDCIELEDRPKTSDSIGVKKCDSNFCRGEGVCVVIKNEPTCKCIEQYFYGPHCDLVQDNCVYTGMFKPCDPIGTEECEAYFGGRYCRCNIGYYGTTCSEKSDLDEYLHSASAPMLYFAHLLVPDEIYELRMTFEYARDTYAILVSDGKQRDEPVSVNSYSYCETIIEAMGLKNIPLPIKQKRYLQMANQFHGKGLLNFEVELFNRKNGFEWKTHYTFQGRVIEKHLSFGSCPPTITLSHSGCCFETMLGGSDTPKLIPGVRYSIDHYIKPCRDEMTLNVTYYVTDLHDIKKIYQRITKVFTAPPVLLNQTSSLVIRVDGPYGTAFAQCYVKYLPKRCSKKGCKISDYDDGYDPRKPWLNNGHQSTDYDDDEEEPDPFDVIPNPFS